METIQSSWMNPPAEYSDETYTEKPACNYRCTNDHFPLDTVFADSNISIKIQSIISNTE